MCICVFVCVRACVRVGVRGCVPLCAREHVQRRSHAHSQAGVNLNFWITPDAANLDAASGGLIVYKQQPPLHWGADRVNNMQQDYSALRAELARGGDVVRVPFKQNRMVMFTSNLWHETMPFKFKKQYQSRRINVTFLFGLRDQPFYKPRAEQQASSVG